MDEAAFRDFMALILPPYVAERAAADHVSAEAAEIYARDQHARLLPNGRLTARHRFLHITAAEHKQVVGGVWLFIDDDNKHAFLYNITILPQFRRKGFASGALVLVEKLCREAGCAAIGLNVFSSNDGAIALYGKVGFRPASSYWRKLL